MMGVSLAVMAATRKIVLLAVFTLYLYFFAIIDSGNSANSYEETCTTLIATNSHIMEYPNRILASFLDDQASRTYLLCSN